MFELSGAAALLQTIGWLYVVIALAALALALYLPKKWWLKVSLGTAVFAAFVGYPATKVQEAKVQKDEKTANFQAKLAKAQALFAERCKTAGEKIYRTVENVDGVFLMKLRPTHINTSEQYAMDDPYGADCHGEQCIIDLLRVSQGAELNPQLAAKLDAGFDFVDAIDESDGKRYRYRGIFDSSYNYQVKLEKSLAKTPTPIYGLTWEDISTKIDRDHWIAGGSMTVLNLQKNLVLAERLGYMMDRGLGSTEAGRTPWGYAYDFACPSFPTVSDGRAIRVGHTRKFILQVLNPTKRN